MTAIILQFLALAVQYGPELGISIAEAVERLQGGESVEDLIKELEEKREDLISYDFGISDTEDTNSRR